VLVIAIDALRADHVSAYGYDRPTMPRLEKLAAEGVLFTEAWSSAPELVASHASILTGCDPTIARRPPLPDGMQLSETVAWQIPSEVPRLAREFLAAGFTTAAFVDDARLSPVYGFDAGFETFTGFKADARTQNDAGLEAIGEKFLRWLQDVGEDEDWFAYLHAADLESLWLDQAPDPKWSTYFEARPELQHVPPVAESDAVFFAVPRKRWEFGGILSLGEYEARYDGTLRRLNDRISRLFKLIGRQGKWDQTSVLVVGTYGFGFGESGLVLESGTLSDVDLHVPWVLRPATGFNCERGLRTPHVMSHLDIAPTLLDLAGLEVPAEMGGVSQLGALLGAHEPARSIAFASGGLQEGFVAIDERWIFEHSAPGSRRPGSLVESWYGEYAPDKVEYRTFLKDRSLRAALGNLGESARDEEAETRLREAGESWFRAAERARDALHAVPWAKERPTPEELLEERRRGLAPSEDAADAEGAG
jgi:arylsulfatase